MKKTISALLACCMLLGPLALPAQAASAPSQQMVEQTIRMMGIITGDEKGDMNLSGLVTRAQFAKMMVAASSHKDTVGSAMGVSPFRDVTYQHWAAGYVKVAVDNGWVNGYMDGTFRPDNSITTEEAAAALLRMLGYTSADLTGSYPAAQLAKYQALGLGDNVTKGQGQYLTRGDCVNIFYNLMEAKTKEGQYYGATLGYPVSEAGVLDYAQLVSDGMEGPYITETGSLNLPFSGDNITVYRNGASAWRRPRPMTSITTMRTCAPCGSTTTGPPASTPRQARAPQRLRQSRWAATSIRSLPPMQPTSFRIWGHSPSAIR